MRAQRPLGGASRRAPRRRRVRHRRAGGWPLAGLLALLAGTAAAAPSQLDKRTELLEKIGLERDATPPKREPDESKPAPDETRRDEPDDEGPREHDADGTASGGGGAAKPTAPAAVTYAGKVHAIMRRHCASCHGPGGLAASTGFRLTGSARADYRAATAQIRRGSPSASPLLREAIGEGHAGGAIFGRSSASYRTITAWIEDGALYRAEAPSGAASSPATPASASPSAGAPTPSSERSRPASARGGGRPDVEPSERGAVMVDLDRATEPDPGADAAAQATYLPYAPDVHALLMRRCGECHGLDGAAKATRYVHRGDAELDYPMVRALVTTENPAASPLLRKGRGESHAAGATIRADSDDYAALLAWIADGARGPFAPPPGEAASAPAATGGEPAVDAVSGASPRAAADGARLGDGTAFPEGQTPPSPLPFSLPFNLQINGKIDLSYERRDYRDHPFGPGRNALASYHHFVYLSRAGAKDPFGFNVELITQQFYEVNARVKGPRGRLRVLFKAGKMLVPFGNEPLFHTSYGGRAGFDQEILPVVWARPGVGVHATVRLPRGVTLSDDLYLIAGHALPDAGAVLNLQADQATLSDFKAGFGDRLGASVGPFTAWYSIYFNPLGFDRTLLMQALDLELWRPSEIPFIRDLSLSLGMMRADVAGAGSGGDYYHFGSYWTLAYQPLRFLTIQYRNGLKTLDNRRGVYIDRTRLDAGDRGSHNLSIYARYKGAYAGLQLFWNLERADEQDDDFMRLTVGYAF